MIRPVPFSVATAVFISLAACHPTPAAPTRATATAGLRFCWRVDDARDDGPRSALRHEFRKQLVAAGYRVAEGAPCDVTLRWHMSYQPHHYKRRTASGMYYSSGTATIRSKGTVVDTIRVDFEMNEASRSQPERSVIPLVNAISASPKLAEFARAMRDSRRAFPPQRSRLSSRFRSASPSST